jgi:adenosylhomocysteine nucleosidase
LERERPQVQFVLAIISAMPEEISAIVESLTDVTRLEAGRRQFHAGRFLGEPAVVAFSRWGKVAAAATVTQLIASYPVKQIVFTGVAGGVRRGIGIGDVVVGSGLIQHDMDARPLFARHEVPLLGKSVFNTDAGMRKRLINAARDFLLDDLTAAVADDERTFFEISTPQAVQGLVASGDKFFSNAAEVDELRLRLSEVCCVEMEGAAAAQVCDEYGIPFGIVRTISDSADESAVRDFPRFTQAIARHYCLGILRRFVRARAAALG